jgi:hypothetical protein
LRLLPLLSTHLSFAELGAELFVAPTTVKPHAASIYRKLGATSAARRSRRHVNWVSWRGDRPRCSSRRVMKHAATPCGNGGPQASGELGRPDDQVPGHPAQASDHR